MTALEKPTGDTYIPNCTTNGMMKRKSRYLTLRAVMYRAGPRLDNTASTMKSGRKRILKSGRKRNHSIMAKSRISAIPNSTSAATLEALGTIKRGKYTLLMRFELLTRLFDASLKMVENS